MKDKQRAEFEKSLELDMAVGLANIGRFRVNVLWQRGEVSMVIRHLKTEIPSIDTLGLPKILEKLIMEPRGLILVVGSTGSGKSTTLASMLDYRNNHRSEEHTSELQSRPHLVCRLLLEKKKKKNQISTI